MGQHRSEALLIMARILFAGLFSAKNFGDKVIATCAMDAYTHQLREMGVKTTIIEPLELVPKKSQHLVMKCTRTMIRLMQRYISKSIADKIQIAMTSHRAKQHYLDALSGTSLVVVVGGGIIKYRYEMFWLYIKILISVAEMTGTRIILNAVGIEGYDATNERCKHLKGALSSPALAAITTRDDISTLLQGYMDGSSKIPCKRTPDPAILCSEIYRDRPNKPSSLIGVGLIRGRIFEANGIAVSPDMLVELYSNILSTLDKNNLKWELFTNGLPEDLELVDQIIKKLNLKKSMVPITIPKNDHDLVSTISRFKAVIAARLHANIIAYSLDIPSIGLSWNPKLHFFGESIGYPERFIKYSMLDAQYIVSQLNKAITEGNNHAMLNQAMISVKEDIMDCLVHVQSEGTI